MTSGAKASKQKRQTLKVDIEEQVDSILRRIRNAGPLLEQIAAKFGAWMRIVVYYQSDCTPAITFRADRVKELYGLVPTSTSIPTSCLNHS